MLDWQDVRPDEPGLIQAEARCVTGGRWMAGERGDGTFAAELVRLDAAGDEIPGAGLDLGVFDSEGAAKSAAERHERERQ